MPTPQEILENAYRKARADARTSLVESEETRTRIELVCRNVANRAVVRLLLACSLAKADKPNVDIRKPYTAIEGANTYSGRNYDETYIGAFVIAYRLPCNQTTAFLTPALRNQSEPLTPETNLEGRPAAVYQAALQLLTEVHEQILSAEDLLAETIRWLLVVQEENQQRTNTMLASLKATEGATPLASEAIVTLIEQHLKTKGASRLPVLVVAAAYQSAGNRIGESVKPLQAHNAADSQTGAMGDIEVTLIDADKVVTGYEMKLQQVTRKDIDSALNKISEQGMGIQNYIFITTDTIDVEVKDYAASLYEATGGIEFVILDCIGFLRHFLHLFHRIRMEYIEAYQMLVLSEPDSSVSQPVKEAWLALRLAAESNGSSLD